MPILVGCVGLPALYEQGHEADYPLDVRLKQAVWVPTSIFIFAAFLWALYYGLRALSACIPPSARVSEGMSCSPA